MLEVERHAMAVQTLAAYAVCLAGQHVNDRLIREMTNLSHFVAMASTVLHGL